MVAAAAAASGTTVGVQGELSEPLSRGLVEELGPSRVTTATVAALRCRLDRNLDAILLRVDGTAVAAPIERSIDVVDGDETAAVRVAVLLVARMANRAPRRAPPVPGPEPGSSPRANATPAVVRLPAPSSAPRRWRLDLRAGVATTLWARPATPRLGPTLTARAGYGPWRTGVSVQLMVCCTTSEQLEVDATSVVAAVDFGYAIVERPSWTVAANASVAIRRIDGTARSLVFAAPGTPEDVTATHFLAGATLEAEALVLEPVWVVFAAGANVAVGQPSIGLPEPFANDSAAFAFGRFAPWFALAARVRIF